MMVRRTAPWRGGCARRQFSMQIRVLAFISIFVAGAAHADSTGDASAEVARCAEIAEAAARLKCFDAAGSRANGAPAAQPAGEAPGRDGFGFSPPRGATTVEDFGKPPPPPEITQITQITATVVELARSARGRPIFILDNGQVWRQIDGDDANVLDLRPGKTMKVAIEMSRLQRLIGGYSFKLTIEGRNGFVRVYRVK